MKLWNKEAKLFKSTMLPRSLNKGFTLIEVLIYIVLFSILMGGGFITAYQMIDGSRKLSAKDTLQEEGNFIMRKISWALTSVDPTVATIPSAGTSPNLRVRKYDGNQIDVQLNGTKIEMKQSINGSTFRPITTDNVSVSSLQFTYITPVGLEPAGITAAAVINGINFTITKYMRK